MDLDKGHKHHPHFTDTKKEIQFFTETSKEGKEEKQGWILEEYKRQLSALVLWPKRKESIPFKGD